MTADEGRLTYEEVRKALRNPRRRYVIYYLNQHGPRVRFPELIDQITTWEFSESPDEVLPRRRKSVYSSLYQTHIPKLEELGIVEYETSTNTVALTDTGKNVSVYFSTKNVDSVPWPQLFIGLGSVNVGGVLLFWNSVLPFQLFLLVDVLFTVAIICVAVWQYYDLQRRRRRSHRIRPDYVLEINEE